MSISEPMNFESCSKAFCRYCLEETSDNVDRLSELKNMGRAGGPEFVWQLSLEQLACVGQHGHDGCLDLLGGVLCPGQELGSRARTIYNRYADKYCSTSIS